MAEPTTLVAREVYTELGGWTIGDDGDLADLCDALVGDGQVDDIATLVRDQDGAPGFVPYLQLSTVPGPFIAWLLQFVGAVRDPSLVDDDEARDCGGTGCLGGFKRGSVPVIRADVQRYLTGTQTVIILERDISLAHYTVETYEDETDRISYGELALAEPTYGDVAATYPTYGDMPNATYRIIEALDRQKPGGLSYTYTLLPGSP